MTEEAWLRATKVGGDADNPIYVCALCHDSPNYCEKCHSVKDLHIVRHGHEGEYYKQTILCGYCFHKEMNVYVCDKCDLPIQQVFIAYERLNTEDQIIHIECGDCHHKEYDAIKPPTCKTCGKVIHSEGIDQTIEKCNDCIIKETKCSLCDIHLTPPDVWVHNSKPICDKCHKQLTENKEVNNTPTYCVDCVHSEIKDSILSCTLMPKEDQIQTIGSDLGAYPVPSNCPLKLVDSAPIDTDKPSTESMKCAHCGKIILFTDATFNELARGWCKSCIKELESLITKYSVEGIKHDQQKLRYDLLTTEALDAIAEVLTYGAAKYADRNWEKGIEYGRVFGALMRHMWAWWRGEDTDPESGLSHLAHAGCNIVFLLTFARRGCYADKYDNRPDVSRNQSQSVSASTKDMF